MNYKTRYVGSMGAGVTDLEIPCVEPLMGWVGYVTFNFSAAASGVIGLYHIVGSDEIMVASTTLSSKQVAHFNAASIYCAYGDSLRLLNDTGTTCSVYVNYVYEPYGIGEWITYAEGVDNTSSTSSESSYSSNSSSYSSASSESSESSNSESSIVLLSSSSISSASSESSISSSISSASSESSIVLLSSSSESSNSSDSTTG